VSLRYDNRKNFDLKFSSKVNAIMEIPTRNINSSSIKTGGITRSNLNGTNNYFNSEINSREKKLSSQIFKERKTTPFYEEIKLTEPSVTRTQCYKTFHGRNSPIIIIS
jgi:hypothetical protein